MQAAGVNILWEVWLCGRGGDLEGITGLMEDPLSGSLVHVHEMLGGPC